MTSTTSDKRQRIPLEQRPHALYRFYDARQQLLYVGITAALPTRLGNHDDQKPWWTEVVDIKVEHFPGRESVLAAEKAAIIAECPLYNVQHNRGAITPTSAMPSVGFVDALPGEDAWTFTSRAGYERTGSLWLYWEVHCDPVSDDWYIDEISPEELWRVWLTRYPRDENAEAIYGPGAFGIHWFVEGSGTFEGAPFRDIRVSLEGWRRARAEMGDPEWMRGQDIAYEQKHDFLAHYTWPVNSLTGNPLQWSRLPVIDKVWRNDNLPEPHAFKGGFIQEATGWKPAPLQPYVNVHQLARMARLYCPEAY